MKNTSWAFIYLSRFLALLGFCSLSYAQGAFSGVSGSTCYPTPAAYCQTIIPSNPPSGWSNIHLVNTNNNQCNIGGYYSVTFTWYTNPQYFPCVPPTPSPTPQPTPTPTPPPCQAKKGQKQADSGGDYTVNEVYDGSVTVKAFKTFCDGDNGCSIRGGIVRSRYVSQGGLAVGNTYEVIYTMEPLYYTGETCSGTTDPIPPGPTSAPVPTGQPTPTPRPTLKPDECPGEVNGQPIVVKCTRVDTKEQESTKTETNSDGSKTETKTDKTTTCDGSNCTTTTSTTQTQKDPNGNITGSTTKTDTTTETKNDFCKNNPKSAQCSREGDFCKTNADLSICKEGKWSEIACGSAPACTGDAVQCAQAANAFKTYCESKKTADALYGTGQGLGEAQSAVDSAMSFGSGSGSLLGDSGSVGIGSFDQSNPWGATCLADTQVAEFEGKSITIPFSKYCSVFELMGRIAVAATLLAAGLFVFRD